MAEDHGSSAGADTHRETERPVVGLWERLAGTLDRNIHASSWGGDAEVHGIPEAVAELAAIVAAERAGACRDLLAAVQAALAKMDCGPNTSEVLEAALAKAATTTTASARGYEAAEQRSAPNPPQSAGE